ncbi:MAG: lamin tail domain-containing protein, partial [Gemmatimonadota bacterium]
DVARLDFLAITEHNHLGRMAQEPELYAGPSSISLRSTAQRFSVDGQFLALFGQEFSSISSGNHGNVLEVGEVISTADVPNGRWDLLLQNWLPNHLDSQNRPAILLLNHPAISSSPNEVEYGRDDFSTAEAWRTALDAHAALINLINGPSHNANGSPGRPSEAEFRRYLNLGFHLAPTADQDNHLENWGSAANTRTGVIAQELTRTSLLEALRERRVYATEDRNLRVIVRVAGHMMGSRVTGTAVPATGAALPVELELSDDDEPFASYQIEVFSDLIGGEEAEVVLTPVAASGNGMVTIPGLTYAGGAQYVYLRITQGHDEVDGQERVWTAPVWFEPGATIPAPSGGSSIALSVDRRAEEATITNAGDAPVDLRNWILVSTRGNQRFQFTGSLVLAPGASVVVTSGPSARQAPPQFVRWTTTNVWNNDEDPAELYNADGHLVAEHR